VAAWLGYNLFTTEGQKRSAACAATRQNLRFCMRLELSVIKKASLGTWKRAKATSPETSKRQGLLVKTNLKSAFEV
jgi:hypothetical protein